MVKGSSYTLESVINSVIFIASELLFFSILHFLRLNSLLLSDPLDKVYYLLYFFLVLSFESLLLLCPDLLNDSLVLLIFFEILSLQIVSHILSLDSLIIEKCIIS